MDIDRNGAPIGRVELLQAISGRVRLRVPEIRGDPARAREVEQQLSGLKSLRQVEVSPVTGSVLVTYDPEETASLVELGRRFFPGLELATLEASPDGGPEMDAVTPSAVEGVLGYLRTINANVRAATGGLDLRILVPAFLVLFGVKTLVSDRERTPAWYNYFWFAFGTFCTLNRRAISETSSPPVAASLASVNGNRATG
jgi:hypothetical protein